MITDIKSMSVEDKMIALHELWDDMRSNLENTPETPEIQALLDERFKRVEDA